MSNLRRRLAELSSEEQEHLLGEVPRLLLEGHRIQRLCCLLNDYAFIEAKINHPDFGVKALIEDYDLIDDVEFREHYYQIVKSLKYGHKTRTALKLIQGALRLSAHILIQDTTQLAGQLSGRLLYFDNPEIQQFLQQISQSQTICLRSLRASLSSPNGRLLSTLSGHISSVNAVAVTPDGQLLISGSSDNTVKVWDLNTGAEVLTFTGHSSPVNAVAVTSDGKRVISGASDNTVRVWNLATGAEVLTFTGHSLPVVALAVTPDGKKAVSASIAKKNSIKVWDLETGKEELTLKGHGDIVRTVAITSCNSVISASDNGTIKVWNLTNGKILFGLTHGYEGYTYVGSGATSRTRKLEVVYIIGVTRDGKWLICVNNQIASPCHFLTVWNHTEKKKIFDLLSISQYCYLSLNFLIYIIDISIFIFFSLHLHWYWRIFWLITLLVVHKALYSLITFMFYDSVTTISITPDGKYLISGSTDKTLKIWNLQTKKLFCVLKGHRKEVTTVTITPDGKYLISGSKDKTIKIWNLKTKKQLFTLTGHEDSVNTISITPDGKYLISGSKDKTIKIWNLETREEIFTFTGHTESINAIKVTSNGQLVISASSDKTIQILDFATRKLIAKFTGESAIKCCAVAPDDVTIIAGDISGSVHFLRFEGIKV